MASNIDALVGKAVMVTMVNDVQFEGVIFSYVPEQDLIIILRNIQDFKTTMHVARIPFIKDIVAIAGKDHLPRSLDQVEQLPTLQTTNQPLFKSINHLIKQQSETKASHLKKLEGAPSGAVECYLQLVKFANVAEWDNHNKSIKFGDHISVESTDDWKTFEVTPIRLGDTDTAELHKQVERVKGYLKKKL